MSVAQCPWVKHLQEVAWNVHKAIHSSDNLPIDYDFAEPVFPSQPMFKSILANTDFLYQLPRSMNGQSCRKFLDEWVVWAVVEADLISRYRPALLRFTSTQHFRHLLLSQDDGMNWDVLVSRLTMARQEPVDDLDNMDVILGYEARQTAFNAVKSTLPRLLKDWDKFCDRTEPSLLSTQEECGQANRAFWTAIQVR